VLIANDMGKRQNWTLAMRHACFLEKATTANRRLDHIVEMPPIFPPTSPLLELLKPADENEKGDPETGPPLGIDVRRGEPYRAASSTGP
jgi:hypothetical protein